MSCIIRCKDLSKYYANYLALDHVSFELNSGEPIALVGPNGAGKTTLFSILCGFIHPSAGSVTLLGEVPGSSALFGKVSALPQDAQFDPSYTLAKQLSFYARLQGFSAKAANMEVSRVLEYAQLVEESNSLPGKLSHGMRKRAAIAQALIGSPSIVFLDEPTAGLDPANARNIRQQISRLSEVTTFVISSHNLQELERLCGTVLLLDKGRLQQQSEVNPTSAIQWSFLTVLLDEQGAKDVQTTLQSLEGVETVSCKSKNEYVIIYNGEKNPDLDQHLLRVLAQKGWTYRQLSRGQSLEDQLFSSNFK